MRSDYRFNDYLRKFYLRPSVRQRPHARNSSVRNSGAGNGSANFVGALHFLVLSAGKPPTLVLGEFLERGGSADFIFMGAGIFLRVGRK